MTAGWYRLGLLLALTGCAGGNDCTLVGCASQLSLRVPASVTEAQACVEDVCTSAVEGGVLSVPLARRGDSGTADVVVTVAGATYRGTVPLQRTFPNGDACPPVCVTGSAVLDLGVGRVVPG